MARHFWPNQDPIGKRVKQGWPKWTTPWREVVGVVADVKLNGVIATTPLHVYMPLVQTDFTSMFLAVRTRPGSETLAASVQSAVHSVDNQIPLYGVRTMDDLLGRGVVSQRAAMILLSAFALVAMLLATIGIYGVISWGVVQRKREMGLRGTRRLASRRDVVGVASKHAACIGRRNSRPVGCSCTYPGARSFSNRSWSRQDAVAIWSKGHGSDHLHPDAGLARAGCLSCLLFAGSAATKIDPLAALRYE